MATRDNIRERAARLKPSSFVPSVVGIAPEDVERIFGLEAVISYWTNGEHCAADWIREVRDEHGGAGFYVLRGSEVMGFLVHAPASMLPRAFDLPVAPTDERTPVLAYLEGDARTSRRLLVRMLRTMKERGVRRIESIASDSGASRHVRTRMLLDNGWRPVQRGRHVRRSYTLMDVELGNAVETARYIIGHVRLPELRSPVPGVVTPAQVSKRVTLGPEEG